MIRRIAGPVQIRFHRRGVEIGAILEFNAFPQFHGVSKAVIGNGVTLRQHVFQFHLFIQTEQPLVKRFRYGLR
ncbi:Uncharacterised protein [Klebsiella pneumoniae]|nr:Uncharacterised protein [Klebsiella pneumoniae]